MNKNKPGYAESIHEIAEILGNFSNEELDVDTLAAQVKRATELINLCKQRLRKAEEDVQAILKDQQ